MGKETRVNYWVMEGKMAIRITDTDTTFANTPFADGEEVTIFRDDLVITKAMTWLNEWEQEIPFTKDDFDHALRKVSRKIKK